MQLSFELFNQPPDGLPGQLILEFGGISGFSGFDLVATAVPVPEPTTAHLVASGLIGLAMKSRRMV